MFQYCRFLFSSIITLFVMFLAQPCAFAQNSGAEGQSLQAPWTMGNIIVVLFAIGLFALLVRTSKRDTSAIPDEFGNRPNPFKSKKKKGKQKLDFSKGPIKHPDLEYAMILTILALLCCNLLVFFSFPAATRVRDEIKGDPRFIGSTTANVLVILNYIVAVLVILNIIGFIVGLLIGLMSSGGAG